MIDNQIPNDKTNAKAQKALRKASRPAYKKKRFILPLVAIALFAFSSINNNNSPSSSVGSTDTTETAVDEVFTEPATVETNDGTASQQNAVRKASDYVNVMAFSRSSLIAQLVFDQFSEADATYAVDQLNPDYNEQAAKKAKDYLNSQPFSRQGLIDQLTFDGFTSAQAEYGVSQTDL